MTPLRDAATVILVRASRVGPEPFDVLMMKRSAKSSFMPDVYVYPGGALDAADCEQGVEAQVSGLDAQGAADRLCEPHLKSAQALGLYMAAAREVFEESGVLLARRAGESTPIDLMSDPKVASAFAAYRQALYSGELSMSEFLRQEELVLELGEVGYFARWVTPLVEKKRFDARFFVVHAPLKQRASHDNCEVIDHLWVSPRDMLARYRAGSLLLAPPTFSTLERLAAFESIDALMVHAKTWSPVPLLPDVRGTRGQQDTELLLPHHPDYNEDLRREHLLPFWDEQRCQDVPDWTHIGRDDHGWVTRR